MKRRNSKKDYVKFRLMTKTEKDVIVYLTGSPKSSSIEEYSRFMKDNGITDIFCFCKPDYDTSIFSKLNIKYHNLEFQDGTAPTTEILDKFDLTFDLILKENAAKIENQKLAQKMTQMNDDIKLSNEHEINAPIIINMHCYTGLGRAPTMLAYLMISRCGYGRNKSVKVIRKRRKGTINTKQLDWIFSANIKKRHSKKYFCVIL